MIVAFWDHQGAGVKSDQVEDAIVFWLADNYTDCTVGSIRLEEAGLGRIEMYQDRIF
jgi:hypothetical protein